MTEETDIDGYVEVRHERPGARWACGGAAKRALEELVTGELVECAKVDEGRYGTHRGPVHARRRH